MIKVWIVGSNGQIGHALNEVLDPLEIEVLNTDKDELDITDTEEVLNFGIGCDYQLYRCYRYKVV